MDGVDGMNGVAGKNDAVVVAVWVVASAVIPDGEHMPRTPGERARR